MPETQKEFAFTREEKFAILRRAVAALPEELVIERAGDKPVVIRKGREDRLVTLMESLIVWSRDGVCERTRDELANLCRFSIGTLRRILDVAVAIEWVGRVNQGNGRPNALKVRYESMISASSPRSTADRVRSTADRVAVNCGPGGGQLLTGSRSTADQPYKEVIPFIPLSPPPPPPPQPEGVEEELVSCGVADARTAVERATGRGVSIDEIRTLVALWKSKPGAYGAGALYRRIVNAVPGEDPAARWPPESIEWKRDQERRKRFEQHQAASKAAPSPAVDEWAECPELDAMSTEELRELVETLTEFEAEFVARILKTKCDPRRSRLTRGILIQKLKGKGAGEE